jgi:hypothetical protein
VTNAPPLALSPPSTLELRMVYGLLEKEFAAGLHALNITAKTPGEIAKAAAKKT